MPDMIRPFVRCTLFVGLLLAGCSRPPPSAYVGGSAEAGSGVAIGRNASNEACTQQVRGAGGNTVDIFCGTWQQPSASITRTGPGGPEALAILASNSPWRSGLDERFTCGQPQPTTILNGAPALILPCTRKAGGWPQVAMVASVGGQAYVADGIQPALPVIPRAIGVLSGEVSAEGAASLPRSGAEALMASRLAAQAFSAGDISQYQALVLAGTRANLAESYAAAESAYRAALTLQQKALGRDNPDQAYSLMLLALQISDQGRYADADALFRRADQLAPRATEPAVMARLLHYRALHELNQGHDQAALDLLRQAEARYAALVPPEALTRQADSNVYALARAGTGRINNPVPSADTAIDPAQQSAIIGVIETRRYQAIALRDLGRTAESQAAIRSAARLAAGQGMRQPILTARLLRTAANSAATMGDIGDAASGLGLSAAAFGQALPGTRPVASTELLRAARLQQSGSNGSALDACRQAATVLRELKAGAPPELVQPCLDVFGQAAEGAGGQKQAVLAEMFEMSQLAQGGITSQQIAQATARLGENARDPRVGQAIRRRQDAGDKLAELQRQRDALAQQNSGAVVPSGTPTGAALDKQIADAQAQVADADAALQAASPNFGQLVQEVSPASTVLAALRPDEAFIAITMGAKSGWVFALRGQTISAAKLGASPEAVNDLVRRFRAGVEPGANGPGQFDTDAAQKLYAATLGQVGPAIDGASSLVIAPAGSLLSVPFAALLTAPADQANLAGAPWLIRKADIAHVPAAANFVSLRKIAGGSRATKPWFGMGDFRPVTLAQAEASFPSGTCQDSAKLFAGLPPLPFAKRELEAARGLLGGAPSDELTGGGYTVAAVRTTNLKDYRILHFAAHGLLPSELRCANEPAIVTSDPAGARDASGALLTASLISGLDLDADAVILSACNSAGPGGPAGESLSGLARSFFFAGARAMMVTHWSVNDQASAFLIADTLRRVKAGKDGGLAGSLRGAQLGILDAAGKAMPAALAHPFYWAPFALIGEGGSRLRMAQDGPGRLAGSRLAGL